MKNTYIFTAILFIFICCFALVSKGETNKITTSVDEIENLSNDSLKKNDIDFSRAEATTEDKKPCLIGDKDWETESIKICDRSFQMSAEGIKNEIYSITGRIRFQYGSEEELLRNKIHYDELQILTIDGIQTAKFFKETLIVNECGDFSENELLDFKREYKVYTPKKNKNGGEIPFAMYSYGPLKENESYIVTNIQWFNSGVARTYDSSEFAKFDYFNDIIKNLKSNYKVSLQDIEKFRVVTITHSEDKKNPYSTDGIYRIELMIDPDGILVYSWSNDSGLGCTHHEIPRYAFEVNGQNFVITESCETYRDKIATVYVKVKDRYYELKSSYLIC